MAWYVFALVDAAPTGAAGSGLSGALSLRKLAGAFVVVERRADVPPVAFGTLRKHQDVVSRLAKQVPAILPVRFGTLLEPSELDEAVDERDEEIAEAFDLVRDRVQFTWRAAGKPKRAARVTSRAGAVSGTQYLRRAARAANPPAPAAFRPLRATLAPLAVRQRYQPGTATLPEAVYHLVGRADVREYTAAAAALGNTTSSIAVTGPFPPFAFAPEIL
jgi:gas vesicle protein GvpL/GvpF